MSHTEELIKKAPQISDSVGLGEVGLGGGQYRVESVMPHTEELIDKAPLIYCVFMSAWGQMV